jgi:hypothetical protein
MDKEFSLFGGPILSTQSARLCDDPLPTARMRNA